MSDMTLSIEAQPSPADVDAVVAGLRAYNVAHVGDAAYAPLQILLRDETGGIAGGLIGDVAYGWLFVRILWLADEHRGGGHGERLVRAAEEEARSRGCHAMWLDTFSFQAPAFYRKLGFQEFGRLDEYPAGHSRHFLWKPLT
jgi:GNAT superfamily N-acetyltransferase